MCTKLFPGSLTGPLNSIHRLVPMPLLRCLGNVLMVVILLEGKPSPQSDVLWFLEQAFIKDLSVLYSIHLSSIHTNILVPAIEKHPCSMMLPPPCVTIGMVLAR